MSRSHAGGLLTLLAGWRLAGVPDVAPANVLILGGGVVAAAAADRGLAMGVNCVAGKVPNKAVADSFNMPYEPVPLA